MPSEKMLPWYQQGESGKWHRTYIRHPRNRARRSKKHEPDLEEGVTSDGIMVNKRGGPVYMDESATIDGSQRPILHDGIQRIWLTTWGHLTTAFYNVVEKDQCFTTNARNSIRAPAERPALAGKRSKV